MNDYSDVMIGLEVHVRLLTQSKLFCSCPNVEPEEPNSNVCPICMGFPGTKPVLNNKAVELATTAALALNCKINSTISFSRKVYFYPDLPKNFQITQYESPVGTEGTLQLSKSGKSIGISRVHIEEDPARLVHVGGDITSAEYALVDYNRSGMPLIEIVTKPELSTPGEARDAVATLAMMLGYLGVCDPSAESAIRVDANISLKGGKRTEIKNITGFANVEKALLFEIARQRQLRAQGIAIEQETRHFDETRKTTSSLRSKETEEDYGYIFEPDLNTYEIGEDYIAALEPALAELPSKRIEKLVDKYGIDAKLAKVVVYEGREFGDFFEKCADMFQNRNLLAKWSTGDLLKCLNYNKVSISASKVTPEKYVEFLNLIDKKIITERFAKELIKEFVATGAIPEDLANARVANATDLGKVVEEVISENAKAVADYKNGKREALQYLIGQVLRKTGNAADPKEITAMLDARVAQ
ncbi:MAG: Asp-tRNA(Asn)/Glu-tRNA(Gln) amidotransferase subunit GatB [Candidatus Micrarchaeia archaeon]